MHPTLVKREWEGQSEQEGDEDQDVVLKDKMASLDNENKRVTLQRLQAEPVHLRIYVVEGREH